MEALRRAAPCSFETRFTMSPGISPLLDRGWANGRGPVAFDYQLSYSYSFSGTGTSSWQYGQQISPLSATSSSMLKFLPQPGHSSLSKASMIFSSTRSSPAVGHFWVRTEISSPWVALRIFWKARFIRTFASGDSVQCNDTLSRTSPPEPLRSLAIFPAISVPAIESRSCFWFLRPKAKILSV